jgi:hypothetical protein
MNVRRFEHDYSDDDRVWFTQYSDNRSALRPKECTGGAECWVRFGPPCYRTNGNLGDCAGCGGRIKTQ